jgi:hypothetical protein
MSQRFRHTLGPNIRNWRMTTGLSQDDVAARLQLGKHQPGGGYPRQRSIAFSLNGQSKPSSQMQRRRWVRHYRPDPSSLIRMLRNCTSEAPHSQSFRSGCSCKASGPWRGMPASWASLMISLSLSVTVSRPDHLGAVLPLQQALQHFRAHFWRQFRPPVRLLITPGAVGHKIPFMFSISRWHTGSSHTPVKIGKRPVSTKK